MARVFTDSGAEFHDLLFWTATDAMDYGGGRSGNWSYRLWSTGYAYRSFTALSELYIRFAFYADARGNNCLMGFRSGGSLLCHMNVDGAQHPTAYVGGGAVEDSGVVMSYNVWHFFEIYVKIADSPNGRFALRMDGTQIINYTGDTKPGSETTVDNIYVSRDYGSLYWDDIAMNDTTGLTDNSWCGDGHVELMLPNDNGDTNSWTGNDGDKVNNYLQVDEVGHDSDTTYVYSNTATEQDMYKVADFSGTGRIINRIWAECRARDASLASSEIKIGFKTSGTVYLCSSGRVLTSNYARYIGDEATINPADSAAWEDADIDAIQFVAERE